MSGTAAAFAAVSAAYFAGHHAGDYWVQTTWQAVTKERPGREGSLACAAHVATYTLALAASLALVAGVTGTPVSPWRAALGLAVSALTHYFADRRRPLRRLAVLLGKEAFWESGEGLAAGKAHLDQSWHLAWLLVAALVTAA